MRLAYRLSLPLLIGASISSCSGNSSDSGPGSGSAGAAGTGTAGANASSGGSGGAFAMAGSGGQSAGLSGSAGQTSNAGTAGQATGGASNGGGGPSLGGSAGVGGMAAGGGGAGGSGGAIGGGGAAGKGGTGGTGGGAGTASTLASYIIGADITWVQADEAGGATYSDGTKQDIFALLKKHGFNYVRLRTFVDPKAADGYDKTNGYADLAHTIAFGKRIKDAGLGLLVDFHYSDNWADPGKQCVPIAWQGYTTIDQLGTAVHDYTKNAITQLIAGGARPDMVQIGNEITPGMLIHRCDNAGAPTGNNPVTGAISNWTNLGTLLKAGVKGVKDVDTGITIMLHIDRGGDKGGYTGDALAASTSFITNAQKQGVVFDVFGESCYQAYQGDPASVANTKTDWTNTFAGLVTKFPNLRFVAAEYGPMQREINDVVFGLAGNKGAGTFNWEPTRPGAWNTGHTLFTANGKTNTATADLSLYDAMKTAYASRL